MARKPRISIGLLMTIIGLVAVDFAVLHSLYERTFIGFHVAFVVGPMINLLLVVAPRLRRGRPTRPYWWGFEIGGWLMVGVMGDLTVAAPIQLFAPLEWLNRSIQSLNGLVGATIELAAAVLLYTPLQVLPALLAARLLARYRVAIRVAIVRREPQPGVIRP